MRYVAAFNSHFTMSRVIRWLLIATYPFLAFSLLILGGLSFGAAFIEDFTVHNKTDQSLVITPVGAIGDQGTRYPLPIYFWRFPALPQSQRGAFTLEPGKSVTLMYDMDDINFSEIVVEDSIGRAYQLVVNPNPTEGQYHAPEQRSFVIDDLQSLDAVADDVWAAVVAAMNPAIRSRVLLGLLIVPWIAYALLSLVSRYSPVVRAGRAT